MRSRQWGKFDRHAVDSTNGNKISTQMNHLYNPDEFYDNAIEVQIPAVRAGDNGDAIAECDSQSRPTSGGWWRTSSYSEYFSSHLPGIGAGRDGIFAD